MFNSKLKARIEELAADVLATQVLLDIANAEKEDLRVELEAARVLGEDDKNFALDFKKLNAISIERLVDINNRTTTSIGYLVEGRTDVQEWTYRCNLATHQRLVQEFNRSVL